MHTITQVMHPAFFVILFDILLSAGTQSEHYRVHSVRGQIIGRRKACILYDRAARERAFLSFTLAFERHGIAPLILFTRYERNRILSVRFLKLECLKVGETVKC